MTQRVAQWCACVLACACVCPAGWESCLLVVQSCACLVTGARQSVRVKGVRLRRADHRQAARGPGQTRGDRPTADRRRHDTMACALARAVVRADLLLTTSRLACARVATASACTRGFGRPRTRAAHTASASHTLTDAAHDATRDTSSCVNTVPLPSACAVPSPLARYACLVEYHGGSYFGWSPSAERDPQQSVAGAIEAAVACMVPNGETVRVVGSGRTDRGVHGQRRCDNQDDPTSGYLVCRTPSLELTLAACLCRVSPWSGDPRRFGSWT